MARKKFKSRANVTVVCPPALGCQASTYPGIIIIDGRNPVKRFKTHNKYFVMFGMIFPALSGYYSDADIFPSTYEGKAAAHRRLANKLSYRFYKRRRAYIKELGEMENRIKGLRTTADRWEKK